jgi:hypothetical protein
MIIPIFLDKQLASNKMSQVDDFIEAQTMFNIKLVHNKLNSKDEYIQYLAETTLDWTDNDYESLTNIFVEVNKLIKDKNLEIHQEILLIKTNGQDSWNLPYTRQNAIILPANQKSEDLLGHNNIHLIVHELFHIISRLNPHIREKLYNIYNFQKTNTIDVLSFVPTMITNPDALHFEYYTDVDFQGKKHKALPIMMFEQDKINWRKLLLLDFERLTPVKLINRKKSSYEKDKSTITSYITHPEEISAETFRILLCSKDDKESDQKKKDLLTKFHSVLYEYFPKK